MADLAPLIMRMSPVFAGAYSFLWRLRSGKHLPARLQGQVFARSQSRRTIFTALPSVLVPPVVFGGLFLGLWVYKCLMTIVFQDKIIYMPYMPPFARREKIANHTAQCGPVTWEEERISSLDGTRIVLCIGTHSHSPSKPRHQFKRHIVICYFQGNGASLPPRLPILSNVLRQLESGPNATQYTMIGLSYRGYWKSSGRASEKGIKLDAQAMLAWIKENMRTADTPTEIILWGQSLGAGVAATAVATYVKVGGPVRISALVLETPFISIERMLWALYPQKWLPYRHLHPFLWNHWDIRTALKSISYHHSQPLRVMILGASRDEVVPPEHANEIEEMAKKLGFQVERRNIIGALHTEATLRQDGVDAVVEFIKK